MAAPQVFDHLGHAVGLGPLIRRGGEGAVFDVANQPGLVAKLYEKPAAQNKADKLRLMIAGRSVDLTRIAAWPTTTLHDRPHGHVRGFVMPKIVGHKEIHKLYGPSHRQREFPAADWAFLIHTAANCAAAFEAIHSMHHLMGDVNPGNVLVSPHAMVSLIDCDSFQVQAHGQTFRCEVGVAEYTPPELQGVVFRDVSRTENHDRFGLAVLIFHLLFMGRHPFAGRYRGSGDMSLDRAIREYRFPFSLRPEGRRDMEPPPLAPTLGIVAPEIAKLFDRAFLDTGRAARPSATEWHSALSSFERQLVACRREPVHKHARHLAACPWCRFEDGSPAVLFFVSQAHGLDFLCSAVDLAPILAELERIPLPQKVLSQGSLPVPVLPAELPASAIVELRRSRVAHVSLAASTLVVLTGLIVWVFMPVGLPLAIVGALGAVVAGVSWLVLVRTSQLGQERHRRQVALGQAQALHERCIAQWQHASGEAARAASETRSRIDALRKDYGQLKPQFDAAIAKLEQSKEGAQRRDHLRNALIDDAGIKGIGNSVKSALLSEGIETAHDVLTHDLDGITGVGEKRRAALIEWARELEHAFRFDPKKDVPAAERRTVVARYRQRQLQIKSQLEGQVTDLGLLSRRAAGELETARCGLIAATVQLAQTQADWAAVE